MHEPCVRSHLRICRPFRRNVYAGEQGSETEASLPAWSGIIGGLTEQEVFDTRCWLAWQPLFGSGMRIGWAETLDIPMEEVADLLEYIGERRETEWKAAFPKK